MKKIIVVTGASSGIGREFVRQISGREPCDEIWVIARRAERLETLKNEIDGARIVPLAIDLGDLSQISVYSEKLKAEKPDVRILMNCAGFGKFEHYENIAPEIHQSMIDLNCKAVLSMTDATLPYMGKGAHIVNVASDAAFQPLPYINVYAATKAFVLSYSRALHRELSYRDISVTAVCPYWTKTEFFDRAISAGEKEVIINYGVKYEVSKVVSRAIRDMYRCRDISVYGGVNRLQRLASKLLPHPFIIKMWMRRQKFNGTPDIR